MRVLYIRSDFWFGTRVGGSISHTAGMISGFTALGHEVQLCTPDPTHTDLFPDTEVVRPPFYMRLPKLKQFGAALYSEYMFRELSRKVTRGDVDFVYQRHSQYNDTGCRLANHLGVPLALEVNDLVSEWSRELGSRLHLPRRAEDAERKQIGSADLVACVSEVLAERVKSLELSTGRVIVNANGVDMDRFHPGVDGSSIRETLGIRGDTVVGWTGTFGPWHGIDTLTDIIVDVARRSDSRVHFLLVGEGPLRKPLEDRVQAEGLRDVLTVTGAVPHEAMPQYLAACDILVSPHGRPKTGRFIGSPTKIFEYMAMGKGIVASRLEQIGEILDHERTALLCEPENVAAFSEALQGLVTDVALRERIGHNAFCDAVGHHSWTSRAGAIIDGVREVRGDG